MQQDEQQELALPTIRGRDHASLALLPITLALRDPQVATGPVSFEYLIEADGRKQRVNVTLSTEEGEQLPIHGDQMVFLALLQLAMNDPDHNGRLVFNRQQVFDLLRWPRAGRYYARLDGALHRLYSVGIRLQSAMLSRNGSEYSKSKTGLRVITEYHIEQNRQDASWVEWGHLVREGFRLGDFKRLDWDLLLALDNPLTAQLYRLIDRVTLDGLQRWDVEWQALAAALGMRVEGYKSAARFRQTLAPHFDALAARGVIEGLDYARGGTFSIHIRNYLRSQLRRVLEELGVYPEAARKLVAGYDETVVMAQCDCLQNGHRGKPASSGGYLTEAIRKGFELRYPDDEPAAFASLWNGMFGTEERRAYQEAGLFLCGAGDRLFETSPDPTAWPVEFRAVVRFMMCHNLDPEEVMRQPAVGLLGTLVR